MSQFDLGLIVSGLPHPLLVPEQNEGWMRIRRAYERARVEVQNSGADVIVVYSTMWPSVIGHQIQADPAPKWTHVDELFHDLGSIPYEFRMDAEFANAFRDAAKGRGLHARTVSYHGFPIDTGSVVALKLLNPDNSIPACIVSSNVYADRAETIVLGKAANDALAAQGKRAVAVSVSSLSNRMFTEWVEPSEDHIHSPKDEEWNRKMLEFLADGRLEDVSQLSREIQKQIRVKKVVNFKPMWWLAAAMGQHNNYVGEVFDYAPVCGTGATVTALRPSKDSVGNKEFDEDDVDSYGGDRNVLESGRGDAPAIGTPTVGTPAVDTPAVDSRSSVATTGKTFNADDAPKPVGAYPHAKRVGDLLYLSGVGPRQVGTDDIPGGAVRDASGKKLDYDVAKQTHAVIDNVEKILRASGSSLERVVDVTAFLIDMDRDFAAYNDVYRERLGRIGPTRTTLEISALPTPIGVEFKVLALAGDAS